MSGSGSAPRRLAFCPVGRDHHEARRRGRDQRLRHARVRHGAGAGWRQSPNAASSARFARRRVDVADRRELGRVRRCRSGGGSRAACSTRDRADVLLDLVERARVAQVAARIRVAVALQRVARSAPSGSLRCRSIARQPLAARISSSAGAGNSGSRSSLPTSSITAGRLLARGRDVDAERLAVRRRMPTSACSRSNWSAICWRVRPAPPLSSSAADERRRPSSWPFRLFSSPKRRCSRACTAWPRVPLGSSADLACRWRARSAACARRGWPAWRRTPRPARRAGSPL